MCILSSTEASPLVRWTNLYSVSPKGPHITCALPVQYHTSDTTKEIGFIWNKLYLPRQQHFAFDLLYTCASITACKISWLLLFFFW